MDSANGVARIVSHLSACRGAHAARRVGHRSVGCSCFSAASDKQIGRRPIPRSRHTGERCRFHEHRPVARQSGEHAVRG